MSLLKDLSAQAKDIIQSWMTAINPDTEEFRIAQHRASICFTCPALKEKLGGVPICGDCGCLIRAKVFSKRGVEACPRKQWKE